MITKNLVVSSGLVVGCLLLLSSCGPKVAFLDNDPTVKLACKCTCDPEFGLLETQTLEFPGFDVKCKGLENGCEDKNGTAGKLINCKRTTKRNSLVRVQEKVPPVVKK